MSGLPDQGRAKWTPVRWAAFTVGGLMFRLVWAFDPWLYVGGVLPLVAAAVWVWS